MICRLHHCEAESASGYTLCQLHLDEAIERDRAPRLNPPDSEACPCCVFRHYRVLSGIPCYTCGVISNEHAESNFVRDAPNNLEVETARQLGLFDE